jgi:hypothetical protein
MKIKRHELWGIWHGMKQRCTNAKRKDYKYYGGKGIKVCEKWQTLNGFIETIPPRPTSLHTLDRIDSNKDYCPENIRWATKKEQAMNSSHCIVVDGKSLSDWSKELNLSISCVSVRYAKYGKKCLSKEFIPNGVKFNGKTKTLSQWAIFLGITTVALKKRICDWGIERAFTTFKYKTRIGNKNAKSK